MIKFIELNKILKEEVKSVYNIVGKDHYLIRQAIVNLKSALVTDLEEFNYIKVDASKIKESEADAILSTLPIGDSKRLVVMDNPNANVVKFINNFDLSDTGIVLACVNAEKLTNAETIDCDKLDKVDISRYILNTLSKSNLTIEEQAMDYIIEACGSNMSNIVNELSKLIAYFKDEKVITIKDTINLVSNIEEHAIYMLTNAIDKKDYALYQKVLNDMSKSSSMIDLFLSMGKYFKRMQYICLSKNDEELAQILNIKPYAIKMSRQSIASNGIKYYLNLYKKYVDLDYKIKSGKISAQNALYELIF